MAPERIMLDQSLSSLHKRTCSTIVLRQAHHLGAKVFLETEKKPHIAAPESINSLVRVPNSQTCFPLA